MNYRFDSAFAVLFLGLALTGSSLHAEPMSSLDARAAVAGWLAIDSRPLDMPLGQRIKSVISFADDLGRTNYYVVELAPAGLVIVSADNEVEPIVAFAPRGRYDPSPRHPFGALVSRDLPERMAAVRHRRAALASGSGADPATEPQRRKWRFLKSAGTATLAGTAPTLQFSVSDVRVAPLVQSAWDQSSDAGGNCYNYFTPNNYVCGCGATAMAQLMRYHCHPSAGVGAGSFEISVDGQTQSRALLGGDGAGGPYHWELMPLDPDPATTETERQHIGTLCHDAGVAGHADYSSDATSMYMPDMAEALLTVFQYGQVIQGAGDGGEIGAGLIAMINPGLDAGLPVILGIYGDVGGHAVIGDGYGYQNGALYHHINLGWGAYDAVENAWYALPVIDPSGATFTTVNFCIYNLAPAGSGEIISGRIVDNVGNPLSDALVMAVHSSGAVFTDYSDSRGIYALAGVPSLSSFTIMAALQGYSFSARAVSTGRSADFEITSGNCWAIDFSAVPAYAPASADFDGDRKTDPALYAQATGLWGMLLSESGYRLATLTLGGSGYTAVPADFDGDRLADPAVYGDATGLWGMMLSSRSNALVTTLLGGAGYRPYPADYNGDDCAEPAVYQESSGAWRVQSDFGQADLQLSNFIFMPATYGPGDYPTVVESNEDNNLSMRSGAITVD